jgi:hypothetical protein
VLKVYHRELGRLQTPSSNRSFNETLNAFAILTSVRTEGFLPPRSKSAK